MLGILRCRVRPHLCHELPKGVVRAVGEPPAFCGYIFARPSNVLAPNQRVAIGQQPAEFVGT